MKGSIAMLLLRYASPLARLRRAPVIGPCVSWIGKKIVPQDTRTWVQVQNGPARGLWLRLNPRTSAQTFEGSGEPRVQEALQQHVRSGMTFYDVGANIGFFSLMAARLVGQNGQVVSFEADPEIALRLKDNLERNDFSWVRVEQKAVWAEKKTVYFARTDPATSPDRGLGHVADCASKDTIQVEAVSLDEYSATFGPPDFVKCDVEGAEVAVFRGAQRLLIEKRPGILCEMHSEENRRILLKEFARLDYGCTQLDEQHILALPR